LVNGLSVIDLTNRIAVIQPNFRGHGGLYIDSGALIVNVLDEEI